MVNFNIPPPLTIFLSPIHIPLLFLFFLYFFHCLLLPLHSPINSSLISLTNSHPKGEGQTLLPFSSLLTYISSHLFHSLIPKVFKSSRRRGDVYTITTSHQPTSPPSSSPCLHGLDYLWSRIQVCGFKFFMLSHMV